MVHHDEFWSMADWSPPHRNAASWSAGFADIETYFPDRSSPFHSLMADTEQLHEAEQMQASQHSDTNADLPAVDPDSIDFPPSDGDELSDRPDSLPTTPPLSSSRPVLGVQSFRLHIGSSLEPTATSSQSRGNLYQLPIASQSSSIDKMCKEEDVADKMPGPNPQPFFEKLTAASRSHEPPPTTLTNLGKVRSNRIPDLLKYDRSSGLNGETKDLIQPHGAKGITAGAAPTDLTGPQQNLDVTTRAGSAYIQHGPPSDPLHGNVLASNLPRIGHKRQHESSSPDMFQKVMPAKPTRRAKTHNEQRETKDLKECKTNDTEGTVAPASRRPRGRYRVGVREMRDIVAAAQENSIGLNDSSPVRVRRQRQMRK